MTARPCRVLYIVFDGTLGGSLASCADFVRNTRQEDFEVTFCLLGPPGVASDAMAAMGVEVVSFGATSWRDAVATLAFSRFLRGRKFDVVHNNARTMFGHLVLAIAARGTPLIYQENGDIHTQGSERGARAMYRVFRRLYDLYVTVGDETLEAMVTRHVPRERIVNIDCPVDLDYFSPGLDRAVARARVGLSAHGVIAGTACRLVHQKDLGLLLDAAERVCASRDDVEFIIAGEGEDRAWLEARVRTLGLGSRVMFIGNRTDMPVLFRAFDMFLMTSHQESFGRTILESLASGTPVVGVRPAMGGGRILAAADGVRIIDGRNPQDLATAILDLCGDHGSREALGTAGRHWVETQDKYRVENWARRLGQLYLDVAAGQA